MYHDTIKINFKSNSSSYGISFDYNFLISKIPQNKFSSINYGEQAEIITTGYVFIQLELIKQNL